MSHRARACEDIGKPNETELIIYCCNPYELVRTVELLTFTEAIRLSIRGIECLHPALWLGSSSFPERAPWGSYGSANERNLRQALWGRPPCQYACWYYLCWPAGVASALRHCIGPCFDGYTRSSGGFGCTVGGSVRGFADFADPVDGGPVGAQSAGG